MQCISKTAFITITYVAFYPLEMTAEKLNSLDQNQAWQNVEPEWILTIWHSDGIIPIFF